MSNERKTMSNEQVLNMSNVDGYSSESSKEIDVEGESDITDFDEPAMDGGIPTKDNKRTQHNQLEKKRRRSINSSYQTLATTVKRVCQSKELPKGRDKTLRQAFDYAVPHLKDLQKMKEQGDDIASQLQELLENEADERKRAEIKADIEEVKRAYNPLGHVPQLDFSAALLNQGDDADQDSDVEDEEENEDDKEEDNEDDKENYSSEDLADEENVSDDDDDNESVKVENGSLGLEANSFAGDKAYGNLDCDDDSSDDEDYFSNKWYGNRYLNAFAKDEDSSSEEQEDAVGYEEKNRNRVLLPGSYANDDEN